MKYRVKEYGGCIDQEMFDKIMSKHRKFANTYGKEGECAIFKKAYFKNVSFARKKLVGVVFKYCVFDDYSNDFCGANLERSAFEKCVFCDGEFKKSCLESTTFKTCMLMDANFDKANAEDCEFSYCQCVGAKFINANLVRSEFTLCGMQAADFDGADVEMARFNSCCVTGCEFATALNMDKMSWNLGTTDLHSVCPKNGSFVGYKKAVLLDNRGIFEGHCIVKLEIPDDAKRSNATTRKCRCDKAKVLGFYDYDGNELPDSTLVVSMFDNDFEYKYGEIMEVDDFDDCAMKQCAAGIHFFMTFEEAVGY